MKRILQAALGITMAILGLSGWIILVKNNAQGDLAFIVCTFCIVIFLTGLGILADACGIEI
jgi:hypothetical protein